MLDIHETINKMTLEEKAILINGYTFFGMAAIERLGINGLFLLDGGTGVNFEQVFGEATMRHGWKGHHDMRMVGSTMLLKVINNCFNLDALNAEELELYNWIYEVMELPKEYAPGCYPPGMLLGATWNKEVVYNVGKALAMDAILFNIDILLGTPNVNLHRDPLNGRLFEGYSEDPCLVSMLAPELVKGVQEYGVVANVKHFAANNQETNRIGIDETISKRALEELYLPGFKACVTEGKVKTVMSAYNKINGVPCTENSWLLKEELIDNWGFDGFVMSDWGAVSNPVEALEGGNDLVMPGYHEHESIINAVNSGRLDENILDDAVAKILGVYNWRLENKQKIDLSIDEIKAYTDNAAYEAAAQGIVMLENNGILPIEKTARLSLLGTNNGRIMDCGAGSAGIKTNRVGNLYDELCIHYGVENICLNEVSENTDYVIYVCQVGGMEGNDRKTLSIDEKDIEVINELDKPVVLVLNTCGPVVLSDIKADIAGVFAVFLPGMMGCKALADIIAGKISPSGKLPISFPVRYEDTPTSINFPGDGFKVNYGEGIFVGYRYYDAKKVKPLYPFGFGLSYSEFEYEIVDEKVQSDMNQATPFSIKLKITNTGKMDAMQVIQMYISDKKSSITKPVKELKSFEKISLKAGESKIVTLSIATEAFASFDMNYDCFTVEEGYYDIILAASSDEADEIARFTVYMDVTSVYSYGRKTSIKIVYENTELREIMRTIWEEHNLDFGFISNCYQYMSNKTVDEALDDFGAIDKTEKINILDKFDAAVKTVRKE